MSLENIGWVEMLGYIATFFIVASFLLTSVRIIRFVNSFGCLLFIIYGVFIDSMPIIVVNTMVVLINMTYLFFTKPKTEKQKVSSKSQVVQDTEKVENYEEY